MLLVDILAVALAVWKLVDTWFNRKILERPRLWCIKRTGLVADLAGCPFCISVWFAISLSVPLMVYRPLGYILVLTLASSFLALEAAEYLLLGKLLMKSKTGGNTMDSRSVLEPGANVAYLQQKTDEVQVDEITALKVSNLTLKIEILERNLRDIVRERELVLEENAKIKNIDITAFDFNLHKMVWIRKPAADVRVVSNDSKELSRTESIG